MQEASMTDNFSTSSQVSPELKDQELEFLNSIFDLARNNKPIALQSPRSRHTGKSHKLPRRHPPHPCRLP